MSEGRSRGHAKRAGVAALLGATMLLTGALFAPSASASVLTFSKAFDVAAIDPDGVATLTFTITSDGDPETGIAFTDTLPTSPGPMTVATTATAAQCGGTVTATAGSGTISFTGGIIPLDPGTCDIVVDVTATTPGTYTNTSGAISSTQTPTGGPTASDTLEVVAPPGFSKAFSPDTIDPNGISTLTFTIDNTGNPLAEGNLDFTDTFPTSPGAMVLATPANASTDCTGGTLTATDGAASFSYTGGSVPADSTCTVQVDVTAPTAGTYDNTSGILTSDAGSSSTATDSLVVTPLVVTKTFVEGSIPSGGTANFNISIRNDGTEPLVNIVADDPLVPECNRASGVLGTLAVGATTTYSCALANVTTGFTNTITVTAEGETSGVVVSAVATAAVTIAAATTTTPPSAAPALALTGSSTGPLTGIGLGVVALGALLVLGSSNRRRLFRRT